MKKFRHSLILVCAAVTMLALSTCTPSAAQDVNVGSPSMVVPTHVSNKDESGSPILISGRVFDSDGKTPLAGVLIHLYHTDSGGRYDVPEAPMGSTRLQADLVTDVQGRYAFRSIQPASYPSNEIPAHIHFSVKRTSESAVEWFNLEFADDPLISRTERIESEKQGRFRSIIILSTRSDGVLAGAFNMRLKETRGEK